MFYSNIKNNYNYFKSDKDNFDFGPFDKIYKTDLIKLKELIPENIYKNLKSYKHIAGKWNKKIYIFEYNEKIGLILKYLT